MSENVEPKKPSGRDLGRRILSALRGYMARALGELGARVDALERAMANTLTPEVVQAQFESMQNKQPPGPEVSLETVRAILESYGSSWALDFERRAQASLERAVDRIPKPKDGEDGVDGKDGAGVDDFDIAIDGRHLTIAMKIGERVEKRTVRLDIPIYRDVYQSGKQYERGDMVTFGGSVFVAKRDITGAEKPEASDAWKLACKRGRDGRGSDE